MMKRKHALSGALLAVGLATGGLASAAISPGDGAAGNPPGEIFWTVWDSAAQVSYTRDTGMSILDFLANPSHAFTFAPDQLYLDTFGSVDPSTLAYSVGAFNSRFEDFPIGYGMVISSNGSNVSVPDVTALVTALATGGFYASGVNADAGDAFNFDADVSALSHPGSSGYYDGEFWGGDIGFTVPFQTGATVGTELVAWSLLLAEDGFAVNSLSYGSFLLDGDGNFTYGTVAPVPIPAAAWLFASALFGLVARRRR